MIGSFSISCCNFLASLILNHREMPVDYKLITCLPKDFPVFSPFSFSSRCLYSTYILLIVSSLALSILPCVHLCPNKCTLPLSMTLFKHSRFLFCSMRSLVYQQHHQKIHHRLIYFQHHPSPLLNVEINTIWRTISDIKVISITLL